MSIHNIYKSIFTKLMLLLIQNQLFTHKTASINLRELGLILF